MKWCSGSAAQNICDYDRSFVCSPGGGVPQSVLVTVVDVSLLIPVCILASGMLKVFFKQQM